MAGLTESIRRRDARLHDLVCFSHLRWNFVYQRPQHLMTRFPAEVRVFYIEEPIFGSTEAKVEHCVRECGVHVVTPHLPNGTADQQANRLSQLMDGFLGRQKSHSYWLWYYTPMALRWTRH